MSILFVLSVYECICVCILYSFRVAHILLGDVGLVV